MELGQLSRGDCIAVNVQSGLPGERLVRVLVLMSKDVFKAKECVPMSASHVGGWRQARMETAADGVTWETGCCG